MAEIDGSRRGGVLHDSAGRRCVLLVPCAGRAPGGLVAGLEARGLVVGVAGHPAQAMLELARGGVRALVVVDPAEQRDLPELLAAAQRYYPTVACWQYEQTGPGGAPQLRKIIALAAVAGDRAGNGTASPPTQPPAPRRQDRDASSPAAPPAPLLTQEEVAMLIGRPFEEEVIVPDEEDEP